MSDAPLHRRPSHSHSPPRSSSHSSSGTDGDNTPVQPAANEHSPLLHRADPFQSDARAMAAAAAADAEDDASCMICLESGSSAATGRLYQPCPCSHVHVGCLSEWRAHAPNAAVCPTCKVRYRIGRERWAVLIGHPLSALSLTVLVVAIVATLLAETVRFVMGTPRPAGFHAQALQVLCSAWRAAEVLSGVAGFVLTLCGALGGVLDQSSADALFKLSNLMVTGDYDDSAWLAGISAICTAISCGLTIWATHHLIRERLQRFQMHAAERVLDIKEW